MTAVALQRAGIVQEPTYEVTVPLTKRARSTSGTRRTSVTTVAAQAKSVAGAEPTLGDPRMPGQEIVITEAEAREVAAKDIKETPVVETMGSTKPG